MSAGSKVGTADVDNQRPSLQRPYVPPRQRFFSVPEVGAIFGVASTTVHSWIKRGIIRANRSPFTPYSHYRIPRNEVVRLIEQLYRGMEEDWND